MKKVLILEENEMILMQISRLLKETEHVCSVVCFRNVKDAYEYALNKQVDLFITGVVLDTGKTDDASGFRFAKGIREIGKYLFTPIIFVTSTEDPKLYAYEKLHCFAYFEKSFDNDIFMKTVNEALKFPAIKQEPKILYFRSEGVIVAVELANMVYAESMNHIVSIHMADEKIVKIKYITLKQFVADADSDDIFQCSRNTVVNKNYIQNVDIVNRFIILRREMGRLEIGVTYKKALDEKFR